MPLKLLRNDYSTRYDKIPVMFIKPVAYFFFFFFSPITFVKANNLPDAEKLQ